MLQHTCPRCDQPLGDTRAGSVRIFPCPACGGHAITLTQLRQISDSARVNALWQTARAAPQAHLPCPACTAAMRAVDVGGAQIDACLACHMLWLDPGEQERLAQVKPPPQLSSARVQAAEQAARRLLAEESVRSAAAARPRRKERGGGWLLAEVVLEAIFWWTDL